MTSPLVPTVWVACAWPLGPLAGVPLGAVERWRLGWVDRGARLSPHRRTGRVGPGRWASVRITEPVTWKELGYGLLLLPLGMVDTVLAIVVLGMPAAILVAAVRRPTDPADQVDVLRLLGVDGGEVGDRVGAVLIGLLFLAVALYLLTAVAAGRAQLARSVLVEPSEEQLGNRLRQVAQSRSRIATEFELERRRIERDLHDGAQQRLTALLLTLGLLRLELDGAEPAARDLAARAQEEAGRALGELRDLVRGIYPATLREEGLGPALQELADRYPLPVRASIDLPRRPAPGVESTVYFAVCEILGNATKHSGAATVGIVVRCARSTLTVTVTDDGHGGVDPARGSGLLGVVDRIEAYGGTVLLSSPPGGPTTVRMDLPCEW
ncbi:sensor histidine kinase [Plantactinospora sonchi]|uniref:histidine kinase n=1 Tax=Plantactinospora sonchi TaxID=1544735 RepID=A0ABU7RVD1_9ACTN